MMPVRFAIAAALAAVVLSPVAVQGQAPQERSGQARARRATISVRSLAERLEQLSQRVDEAMKAAADLPMALKTLQDIDNRVVALQQQLVKAEKLEGGFKALRERLDQLTERIDDAELQLSAMAWQSAGDEGRAGYRDGFFIESADQRLSLRFGALLQAAYIGRIYDEEREESGTDLGIDASSFSLRRARIRARGHLMHVRLTYDLELDFGTVDPGGPLLTVNGNLTLFDGLELRAGKMKVPFSRQFLIHASSQQFVERSPVVDAFVPGWDLGVMVHGELFSHGILAYQMGLFNGAGSSSTFDDNTDLMYAARAVFSPLGGIAYDEGDWENGPLRVALGGSVYYNLVPTDIAERQGVTDPRQIEQLRDQDGDGEVDNVGVYGLAAELTARWAGIGWQSEMFYRREDPGAVADDRVYWGIYSQLSYFYRRASLELAARYGYRKSPDFGVDRRIVRPRKLNEVAVVIAGMPWGRRIKWQAEYAHHWLRRIQNVDTVRSDLRLHQVRLQLQLAF